MATYYWRGGTGSWTNASTGNWAAAATAATFTASRATTVLDVTAVASGTIAVGDTVWHTNGTSIGIITSLGTGSGGTGTYNMDTSGTVTSRTMSSATIGAGPTTSADDVVFDADSNVGTATFAVTTANTTPACNNFSATGLDGAMTLTMSGTAPGLTVHGNWVNGASNFIVANTADLSFAATSGTKTITTNGVSFTCDRVFNGVGGTWQLQDNWTGTREGELTNGTLDLNGFTFTGITWLSNNTNTRTLAFGTGKIVCTSNSATVCSMANVTGLTVTGTPIIEYTYAGATGTRTIAVGSTGGTEARSITHKITAGTDTVAITTGSGVRSLDFTGFAGTLTNTALSIYGSLTLAAGMTATAGTSAWTFAATSGTQTITSNGITIDWPVTINGVGTTVAPAANTTIGSTRLLTLTNGTLNLAGFTLSAGTFATASGTKNITWNGGTLTVVGSGATAFNNAQPTNFTTTAGSGAGTINMSSASDKTFVGGGSTFNAKLNQGGAGILSITGANTFTGLSNTTQPASILFTAATTTTFSDASAWALAGTSGNLITLGSITAASHTLSCASGTVDVDFCTISRSTAQGGATWLASTTNGNVDDGNNSGWNFSALGGGVAGNNQMLLGVG